ncbi:MAG TPA: class D sortase [Chloroflexi bacterium]|nr:class D sortase [Chloroflexota bacterium]
MKDRRPVDELSIEELEEILRIRKAEARLERLRRMKGPMPPVDPLAPSSSEVTPPPLPNGHLQFQGEGATAGFRARPVDEEPPRRRERRPRRVNWAWVRDKALLIVEVAALIGLIVVLIGTWQTMQELNREVREAREAQVPTPTPTPLIQVVMLPGGHTPPDELGQSEPEPIPAHLRDLVAQITPLPVPTPGPEQPIRIRIPSIGVDAPVVEGDDWESLKRGAGHHIGSANPGERGNCIISAHNDIYGEIFRDLPEVELGDVVEVYTASQVYRYVVTQKRIIEPTDVSVMYPTSTPVLTLISCYPYGVDTHRIVVIAELQP